MRQVIKLDWNQEGVPGESLLPHVSACLRKHDTGVGINRFGIDPVCVNVNGSHRLMNRIK